MSKPIFLKFRNRSWTLHCSVGRSLIIFNSLQKKRQFFQLRTTAKIRHWKTLKEYIQKMEGQGHAATSLTLIKDSPSKVSPLYAPRNAVAIEAVPRHRRQITETTAVNHKEIDTQGVNRMPFRPPWRTDKKNRFLDKVWTPQFSTTPPKPFLLSFSTHLGDQTLARSIWKRKSQFSNWPKDIYTYMLRRSPRRELGCAPLSAPSLGPRRGDKPQCSLNPSHKDTYFQWNCNSPMELWIFETALTQGGKAFRRFFFSHTYSKGLPKAMVQESWSTGSREGAHPRFFCFHS